MMRCPQCGASCEQDDVDVGIGTVPIGPWGCPECHWVQAEQPIDGDDGESIDRVDLVRRLRATAEAYRVDPGADRLRGLLDEAARALEGTPRREAR